MRLIEVRGLKKSFGSLEVLKDVSLTVEQGERVAIIGSSGCGKSVFLRSLCLLEKPDAGQVFIDGQEITAKGARVNEIRRRMGMLHQQFHLFSEMNVMDNLCLAPTHILKMPRQEAEKKAMELLGLVGLANCADAWPTVLSGGQQQRIAICRVTHEMNFAREVADRVLFFADGDIYEQGTPAEIFDAPKREKTISFIHKIKYFSYEIRERQFDLMRMQGGIQSFGEKYGLAPSHIFRLRLCCEELIYELLANCYPNREDIDLNLLISHAELDDTTQIDINCSGAHYNPFEQKEDNLGVMILKKMSRKLEFHYTDNRNQISIKL